MRILQSNILRWYQQLDTQKTLKLFLLSLLVGLSSGAGIWVFKRLIDLFHILFNQLLLPALDPLGLWVRLIPLILGGLIVGLIVQRWIRKERYHGVSGIMVSVAMAGGRLPYRVLPIKAVTSALSIGAGASVGPEDPSIQIGANLASMIGQHLHLSDEQM